MTSSICVCLCRDAEHFCNDNLTCMKETFNGTYHEQVSIHLQLLCIHACRCTRNTCGLHCGFCVDIRHCTIRYGQQYLLLSWAVDKIMIEGIIWWFINVSFPSLSTRLLNTLLLNKQLGDHPNSTIEPSLMNQSMNLCSIRTVNEWMLIC